MADHEYKFILLGDSGVGKSTFFHRLRTGDFVRTDASIGRIRRPNDSLTHRVKIDGKHVKVILYDTCGEEQYRTVTTQFYRKTDAVLLMYSVEDTNTFENLRRWISDAKRCFNNEEVVWVLIGNKSDLPLYVQHGDIEALCHQLSTHLSFFTSAKTGERVQSTFDKVITETHRSQQGRPAAVEHTNEGPSIRIVPEPTSDVPKPRSNYNCC